MLVGLYLLGYLFAVNWFTYATYGSDKAAAREHRRRVPEANLHFLAILGGWPGALLAQKRFRHKLRKDAFMSQFWVTVLVNLLLVAGLAFAYQEGLLSIPRP